MEKCTPTFVHDLNQFVTVQLLEATPAVLSLGKLCKDHGWVSGQEPRLTPNGMSILCKTDNFVPLVVPGFIHQCWKHFVFYIVGTRCTPSLWKQGCIKLIFRFSFGTWRTGHQETGAGIPEGWQDKFVRPVGRLPGVVIGVLKWQHPHTFLRTQSRNILRKWQPGSTVLKLTSQKNRNCEICKRINFTWAPCRRRTGEALPRAEKLGDLITADYKVLNEGGESRDNHWYAVVIQDLATQWIQSNPCNTKTSQESENRLLKFLESSQAPKVEKTDISMEFGKSWEDLSWNHCTSTLIDPKLMA